MSATLRRRAHFPFAADDLWDFLLRSETFAAWAGGDEGTPGAAVRIPDGNGGTRTGRVVSIDHTRQEITLDLSGARVTVAAGSRDAAVRRVHRPVRRENRQRPRRHRLPSHPAPAKPTTPRAPAARSTITLIETGNMTEDAFRARGRGWDRALRALHDRAHGVQRRRGKVRQAVIVIHGIGEQLPGATLTGLVSSGVLNPHGPASTPTSQEGSPANQEYPVEEERWVKPDFLSDSFELRKVTIRAGDGAPTTDVYELYWANLIRDTTLGQVGAWASSLLLVRQSRIPPPLRRLVFALWTFIALVVAGLVVLALTHRLSALQALVTGGVFGAVVTVLLKISSHVANGVLLNYVGDAARYLRPEPDNIAHRQQIRTAGVQLLERMHDSGRYDRIVVLGHSLGSVIAYDILTFAWTRMNRRHRAPAHPGFTALAAVEKAAGHPALTIEQVQDLQHAAWQEHRRNTQPWLVTDLITVGSPLTYGDYLMAASTEEFEQQQRDRILPTAPPQLENVPKPEGSTRKPWSRFGVTSSYRIDGVGASRSFTAPHHAALFAVTRWTNLFFHFDKIFRGDPVGGPCQPLFGAWVHDIPMPSPRRGAFGFAHTDYWQKFDGTDNLHLTTLSQQLRLASRPELARLNNEIPAQVFVRDSSE